MTPAELLPIAAIAAVFWLLIIRPASARRKAQARLVASLAPGQRIMTTAGVFGTVAALDGARVSVEIAPGVVIEMVAQAVAEVLPASADPGAGTDAARQPETAPDLGTSAETAADLGTAPETAAAPGTAPETAAAPGTAPETTAAPGTAPETAADLGTAPETAAAPEGGMPAADGERAAGRG